LALRVPVLAVAAARYAERGWSVFPAVERGKRPATRNGLLDASTDRPQVEAWWDARPNANIGVACGPSGLLVVDVDGEEGRLAWLRLAALNGGHEPTCVSETGTGGLHVFFAGDGPSTTARLGPGVDTRGQGGYVVAPPSVHPNGRRYRWRDPFAPIAPAPGWLLDLLRTAPIPLAVGERRGLPAGQQATPYGAAALAGLADELLRAAVGTRNATFHKAARRAGRLEAAGELDGEFARGVLWDAALEAGLERRELSSSWRSGFRFGQRYPAVRGPR
jgi:hypothetical protein